MHLFVSTMFYALGRQIGMRAAEAEIARQLSAPDADSLPVVRTIHRFRGLADILIHFDWGATCIGKGRTRAFHEAYKSTCDAWVSMDDDVEVTTETCGALLDALDESYPRVVVVPFYTRGPQETQRLNITPPMIRVEREFRSARLLKLIAREHGFGMVGINRPALKAIVAAWQEGDLWFRDDDGVRKLALFHDELEPEVRLKADPPDVDASLPGRWFGEDYSFFRRVPESVTIEALLVGGSLHDGSVLKLGEI